ncbi:MAG: immunoglobulin domain-containing protein [Phycisphaerales bacterium]|nr:immunoglobulin domain-containing protein [Phycisphaerales bacterium]
MNRYVYCLEVLPNGDLAAGGDFTAAGDSPATNVIARWNGATWSGFGSGITTTSSPDSDVVSDLVVLPNGDLVASGTFTTAGGQQAQNIARWNGSNWSAFGPGVNGWTMALAALPNGDLLAGGSFSLAGDVPARNIARWHGSTGLWTAFGSGVNSLVMDLAVLPNGVIVAGGDFNVAGDVVATRIAQWGPPRIMVTIQPESTTISTGQTVTLSAAINEGLIGVSLQWTRNGVNLSDGPGGASPGGGTVSGATTSLPSPTTTVPVSLTIVNAQASDSGVYSVVFASNCDNKTSTPALVTVNAPPCPADFNGVGGVDSADIFDFLNAWYAFDPRADFNGVDGINTLDIFDFLNAWFTGC